MTDQPPSAPQTKAGRALHRAEMFDLTNEEDRRRLALAIESEAAATERRATVERIRDGVMFLPLTVEDEVQLHLVLAILDRSGEER